jgi:hypothetical protein
MLVHFGGILLQLINWQRGVVGLVVGGLPVGDGGLGCVGENLVFLISLGDLRLVNGDSHTLVHFVLTDILTAVENDM